MDLLEIQQLQYTNLYEILGLTKEEFTPELGKKAYRKLALKYHPDKNPDAPANKFDMIQLAYLILSTGLYKEQYDNVYDSASYTKTFEDLKKNREEIHIEKISEKEFLDKINNLNIQNNAVLTKLDAEEAAKSLDQLINDRNVEIQYDFNMKDELDSITDREEANRKFNELFEKQTQEEENRNKTDLALYERINTVSEYSSFTSMAYNTMYSTSSVFEDSFKLNNVPKYQEDTRSFEERMKEYNNQTDELNLLAQKLHESKNNPELSYELGSDLCSEPNSLSFGDASVLEPESDTNLAPV